LILIFTSQYGQ